MNLTHDKKWHETVSGFFIGLFIIGCVMATFSFVLGICVAMGIKGYELGMGF